MANSLAVITVHEPAYVYTVNNYSASSYCFQPVLWPVRMEGHAMKETVHVTVLMATVGLPAEVGALCGRAAIVVQNN